jgi:hypothetical protein
MQFQIDLNRSMALPATVAVLAGCLSIATACEHDIFALAAGTWGSTDPESQNTCSANPVTYSFSKDRNFMYSSYVHPVPAPDGTMQKDYVNQVLDSSDRVIRMQLEGETRVGDDGKLYVWDLTPRSETMCWRRTD